MRYGEVDALHGVDLTVGPGERVAIVGPSGSGKSTLLYVLAAVLRPSSGVVRFDGADLAAASEEERSAIRRSRFGFVFQFAELVPELSLVDNVALPLRLNGTSPRRARQAARSLLDSLGVGSQADRRPPEVSGGQAQRAAVARAVIHGPTVVFADEPTGALDSDHAGQVLDLLVHATASVGSALVLVTHEAAVTKVATRSLSLVDGRVAGDRPGLPGPAADGPR